MMERIEMESNMLLSDGKASPGVGDFVRQEREWMLRRSGILSSSELEEVDIWTMLICKASRYPMALFSYDIEQKAQLRKEMMAFLNELEEKNK